MKTRKTISVQATEAKRRFSDYVAKAAHGDSRVVITRRGRPVAALVSMDDLRELEQLDKRSGLAAVVGKWTNFEEIADDILEARHKSRHFERIGTLRVENWM